MDIFNFKCKYCGGELSEIEGLKSVGKCKYCGSKQTLPKLENEKRANLFERANHLRRNNEFDKAEALYEQLLNEDLSDPEAYWSLVLCRYGIEYVEDTRTKERKPTVNRMQMTSILGDEDYKSAIANADDEQKKLYEEEAKVINEIQRGILEIARKEEPFDIFICYKETDSEGKRSRDSILAQDLYHELTRDGYKVFFARVTLQGKLGSAYEPYIFSALNSAKVMVVLGTKKEHFEAVWVRNEWSRFLGQIKKGERKVLIPAYRDMDAYDLPVEFSNLQALDMSRLGFLQELVEGVENILKSYKKKETPSEEPIGRSKAEKSQKPKKDSRNEPKKKSKALPIIIIALILALGIGAAFVLGGDLLRSSKPEETDSEESMTTEKEQGGEVLDPVTNIEFTKFGNTYYVSGIGIGITGNVVIPDTYDGFPVTSIGQGAFANCTTITAVSIPSNVKTIGSRAFENCSSLEKITLTSSTTSISANAFRNCIKLANISFEGTAAQWNAIAKGENWDAGIVDCIVGCNDSNIAIGTGPETNETESEIRTDTVTDTETETGGEETTEQQTPLQGAFEYQINDEGNGYSIIGIGTVTSSDIVIPSEHNGLPVVRIGIKAFYQCANITSVTITNSIAGIGSSAFKDCTSLTTVTIGKDLANIASDAFAGCTAITTVNFGGSQTDWEGISISGGNTALTGANIIFAEAEETELEIDNPVTTFEEGVAYYGVLAHKNLGKLVYLNGLMDGEYYLGEADEIGFAAKVYFEKAPTINYYMYFLEGSTKVYVNVNVSGQYLSFSLDTTAQTVWHYNETYKCPMTNINGELIFIGTSNTGSYTNFCAKRIADGPDFFKLQLVKAGGGSSNDAEKQELTYELSSDGSAYIVTGPNDYSGSELIIPSMYNGKPVRFIGENAFGGNTSIQTVYIPRSIVYIDDNAINEMPNLVTVNYEGSFDEWREINFDQMYNDIYDKDLVHLADSPLVEPDNTDFTFVYAPDGVSFYVNTTWLIDETDYSLVVIPNTYKGKPVIGINDLAFAQNTKAKVIYLPASVCYIGKGAFYECARLSKILYGGSQSRWDMMKIEEENNENISSITVEVDVKKDGVWSVIGSFEDTGWTVDFPMTESPDNTWISEAITMEVGDEFKVRMDGEWKVDFGTSLCGSNVVVTNAGVYKVKFIYDPTTMTGSISLIPVS